MKEVGATERGCAKDVRQDLHALSKKPLETRPDRALKPVNNVDAVVAPTCTNLTHNSGLDR